MPVLEVEKLSVHFQTESGLARAVDEVSFSVDAGRTHVLIGESGCGKSVTALAILGLLPPHNTRIPGGRVLLEGRDILRLGRGELRTLRGAQIAMIFQEPMTALNPVMKVGRQIQEAIEQHLDRALEGATASGDHKYRRTLELIEQTGMNEPDLIYHKYPHELSGGMRQRIMIAMALACRPRILIADEPTTALDVTIQAQILDLMRALQKDLGTAILFITHNMGVVAQTAHTMSVMYAGRVVESGTVRDVFEEPCHPYTRALFKALPTRLTNHRGKLQAIPGSVPPATAYDSMPSPCRFFERCAYQDERCFKKSSRAGHFARCDREPGITN